MEDVLDVLQGSIFPICGASALALTVQASYLTLRGCFIPAPPGTSMYSQFTQERETNDRCQTPFDAVAHDDCAYCSLCMEEGYVAVCQLGISRSSCVALQM